MMIEALETEMNNVKRRANPEPALDEAITGVLHSGN